MAPKDIVDSSWLPTHLDIAMMQHRSEGTNTLHPEKVAVIRRAPLPALHTE